MLTLSTTEISFGPSSATFSGLAAMVATRYLCLNLTIAPDNQPYNTPQAALNSKDLSSQLPSIQHPVLRG